MANPSDFAGILGGIDYDLFNRSAPHVPALQQEIGKIISNLKNSEATVIDIGVGTGDTSAAVLNSNEHVSITAIDIEEQMIEAAKTRFCGEDRIKLVHADAKEFLSQLPDRSIDAIISGFCLHNLNSVNRSEVVKEINRTLKNGGIFVTCDKVALNDPQDHLESLTQQILAFDVYLEMDRADYREEWIRHYLADDQHGIRISESEWTALLLGLGFHSISFTHRTLMDCLLCAFKS